MYVEGFPTCEEMLECILIYEEAVSSLASKSPFFTEYDSRGKINEGNIKDGICSVILPLAAAKKYMI